MKRKKSNSGERTPRVTPEVTENVNYALGASKRILNSDLGNIPVTRVTQFVIGWMRAAFDQSRTIAMLTEAGLAQSASPNRRSFAEIAVRLQWLHTMNQADRAGSLDAMLDHERELTEKNQGHLREMGFDSRLDLTGMREFTLEAAEGALKDQARAFRPAAASTDGQSVGLYAAWRHETQYTHATGEMAAAYAPATLDSAYPKMIDPDLTSHLYALFLIVTLVYNLLIDEGVDKDLAMVVVDSFLDVQ